MSKKMSWFITMDVEPEQLVNKHVDAKGGRFDRGHIHVKQVNHIERCEISRQ